MRGNTDETEKAAPGLCHDLWQEGDGNVLVYGGDAQSLPDEHFLSRLKRLRPGKTCGWHHPRNGSPQRCQPIQSAMRFYGAAREPIIFWAGRLPSGYG